MRFQIFLRKTIFVIAAAAVSVLPGCRASEKSKKKQETPSKLPSKPKKAKPLDKPLAGVDKAVEKFTGAHTRIIWAEHERLNESDTFANGNELVLKGLDTRDGKGERMIQSKLDNYSRPLLSTDGEVILFSDKKVSRKAGRRHYDPVIFRTDWRGAKPVRIAEGYAVDCWRDPATGVEWVYAAREFRVSKNLALEAARLVRFMLDSPATQEIVYDDGPISPDNIQFSRDGSQASCLFPWPNVGLLIRGKDGKYHAQKLLTGCWPSLSPDNSGVLWVFDGDHREATFFSDGGKKSWGVKFNQAGIKGREMYHPRWSNHPRYLALTGPYLPVKNASGNVISKGGASAEIHLGRFSEKLDKVEAWLQVTHDKLSESFPDVWIEGADDVQLPAFTNAKSATEPTPQAETWPVIKDGLVFLWSDHNAVNHFEGRDRKMHTSAQLEAHDAARFGRLEEMLVDGGEFHAMSDTAGYALNALQSRQEVTVEMSLLPAPVTGESAPPIRNIFRGPNFTIGVDDAGAVIVAREAVSLRSVATIPAAPSHLLVVRRQGDFNVFINGEPVQLAPQLAAQPAPPSDELIFGGGWDGGIFGVAIHDRALDRPEAKQQSLSQLVRMSKLAPMPRQVKVSARLVEASAMPSAEGIAPYTGALIACVYEPEKVLDGELPAKRILVKHWAMLDQKTVIGLPRETGKSYELTLEAESDHPHLKGERVMDDTTAFDLEAWFDVSSPRLK